MISAVLDASALLALLNKEPGADQVEAVLTTACMSSVNFAEVVTKLVEGNIQEQEIRAKLAALEIVVIPLEQEQALTVGFLRPMTKDFGLSLGDRACLSLAIQRQLPVLTTDRAWTKLNLGLEIQVIR